MKKNNTLFYLLLLFILGILLRFYRLTEFPPSLNWDEVSHAYNSFSLLHTGRDQWGQFLPLFNFRAYGDYPAALNILLTVVPMAVLGATDFAARFPHALIGSLSIFTVFAAAYYWRKNKNLALLAALFVCLDPWTFFPSRAVFQSNWVVFFLSMGLAFFYKKDIFKALLFWGISLYAYHNTRIFVPLLVIPLVIKHIKNKQVLTVFVLLYLPIMFSLMMPSTRARNTWVGIIDPGAVSGIETARNTSTLPSLLSRLIYNRPVYFLSETAKHYVGYFSPKYLFISGGTHYQFSLQGYGVLPWVNLPFFYVGLFLLVLKKEKFLAYWLLLAPLPAAVTRDSYAVIRSTTMLPAVQLITAWGLICSFKYFKKYRLNKILLAVYALIYYLFMEQYLVDYITRYPVKYSSSWQYGYRQAVMQDAQGYDKVIFTKKYGEPHEYMLWYNRLLNPDVQWDFHSDWYWVNRIEKYYFVNDWEMGNYISKLSAGRYLVIASPQTSLPGTQINQINFLDGAPAFIVKQLIIAETGNIINTYEK